MKCSGSVFSRSSFRPAGTHLGEEADALADEAVDSLAPLAVQAMKRILLDIASGNGGPRPEAARLIDECTHSRRSGAKGSRAKPGGPATTLRGALAELTQRRLLPAHGLRRPPRPSHRPFCSTRTRPFPRELPVPDCGHAIHEHVHHALRVVMRVCVRGEVTHLRRDRRSTTSATAPNSQDAAVGHVEDERREATSCF